MKQTEATSLVVDILARHAGLDADEVTLDLRIREDLGLDSIDAVELLMVIEQETGRRFDLADAADVATVGHIVARLVAAVEVVREPLG
jgi:acyl carrier protein